MPALALTDLVQRLRAHQVLQAARARGVKPIAGCDVWITHDSERDAPFRAILLAADRAGYLRLCDWLSRAYRTNQHRGRAELRREWFAEGTDGLIALSGGRARRRRRGAGCRATPQRRRTRRTRMGRVVSAALLPRSAARGPSRRRCAGHGHGRARGGARAAGGRDASGPVSRARGLPRRTRRACASPKATCSPTRDGRGASRRSNTSRRRPRWRSASPTCPKRSPTAWRSRSAAT